MINSSQFGDGGETVNSKKLKAAYVRAGYTQETLAKAMGMGVNTLNAKVNNTSKITTDEAKLMCKILGINKNSEKVDIFLS